MPHAVCAHLYSTNGSLCQWIFDFILADIAGLVAAIIKCGLPVASETSSHNWIG
jgi:hypothetical protein